MGGELGDVHKFHKLSYNCGLVSIIYLPFQGVMLIAGIVRKSLSSRFLTFFQKSKLDKQLRTAIMPSCYHAVEMSRSKLCGAEGVEGRA